MINCPQVGKAFGKIQRVKQAIKRRSQIKVVTLNSTVQTVETWNSVPNYSNYNRDFCYAKQDWSKSPLTVKCQNMLSHKKWYLGRNCHKMS